MNTIPQPAQLDSVAKCFFHILKSSDMILANGKPTLASQEDWDLAVAALDAFADEQAPAPRGTEEAE